MKCSKHSTSRLKLYVSVDMVAFFREELFMLIFGSPHRQCCVTITVKAVSLGFFFYKHGRVGVCGLLSVLCYFFNFRRGTVKGTVKLRMIRDVIHHNKN